MSIAEKLTQIAENEKKVHEAGHDAGKRSVWDMITNDGQRTSYEYGFYSWGSENFEPPYKIIPTSRSLYMFERAKINTIKSDYLDLSQVTIANGADSTSGNYCTFRYCTRLESVEDIGMPAGGYYYTFGWCSNLKTVEVMRCRKEGAYSNPFSNCPSLENITIEGVIGNNFTMIHCPLLTGRSIKSIVSALFDFTGTADEYTRTLTLHKDAVNTLNSLGATSPNGNTWVEYIDDKKWNLTVA